MNSFAIALGVLAGLVLLLGYWQYNQVMLQYEGHKPNTATWFMWGVGGISELIIYAALVSELAKEILPAMCAGAITLTFLHVWWREKSLNLTTWDWVIIGLDAGVVTFYFITHDPITSNILLGFDMIISFIPILISTWKQPATEHPLPWRTWTIAYVLFTVVVLVQWTSGWELIYPVLYMILHGAIWVLSNRRVRVRAAVV